MASSTAPNPGKWKPIAPAATSISPLESATLLPCGEAYLGHVRRTVHKRTLKEDVAIIAEETRKRNEAEKDDLEGVDDFGVGDEEESVELTLLDPKEWKQQDHYKVLGLSKFRYKATDDQIKIAHRKKVLKHHPDKKAGLVGDSNDDAFFKCIQKAMDTLSNAERRRQFDSVDPYYVALEEDQRPDIAKDDPEDFFSTMGPVFEREARFSKKSNAPMLGETDDSKAQVEGFYDFWYNFDSWRSFEYLDKEINEGSDNRDDKRYTERKNKAERARRKKEDTARLRTLVDHTLAHDPRIKRIKQQEKEDREAKKRAKSGAMNGVTKAQEEAERKKQEEEEAKAKEEAEKATKADAKKAKAAAANAAKKARRAARANEEQQPNGSAS